MARMSRLATLATGALCLGAFAGVASGLNPPHSPDDHFLCYKTRSSAPFSPVSSVTLADEFESGTFTIKRHSFPAVSVCPPADKNSEGIVDSNTHLVGFQVAPATVTSTAAPRNNIRVVNQLDDVQVDVGRVRELLVPANKSVAPAPPPPAPDLGTINVDHYKCYLARLSRGQPRLAQKTVTVGTQFETRKYNLVRIRKLCTPVDKNGGGIKNPLGHLLCYQARRAPGEAAHTSTNVSTNDNEFGVLQLEVRETTTLCVPSLTNPAPAVCGDDVAEFGEQCDNTDDAACPGQCITKFQGHCTCDDFATSTDCPAGQVCAPTPGGGNCFTGCIGGPGVQGSCPNPTQICSGNPGVCLCSNAATDCSAGQVCQSGACITLCNNTSQCPVPSTAQTCDGIDACECPGPHPFVLQPGDSNAGTGSLSIPRGTLAPDSDGVKLPLAGSFQVVVLGSPPSSPTGGVFALSVPPTAFPVVNFLGQNVCAYLVDLDGDGSAGSGLINCFGAPLPLPNPPSSDYTLYADHCTACDATGGSSCDSGQQVGTCNCATNAGCSGGQVCSSGFCFTGCAGGPGPGTCTGTQFCTGNPGVCLCGTNADCPAGETCSSGACVKTCASVANCTAPAPTQACTVQPNSCTPAPGWTGPATALNCGGTPFDSLHNTQNHPGIEPGEPAVCVSTLPVDAGCDDMAPTGSKAVREIGHCSTTTSQTCTTDAGCPTGERCQGHCSVTTTQACADDGDCPGTQTCSGPSPHNAVCNGPTYFVPGKQGAAPSWAAQATFMQLNLAIQVQGQAQPCSPNPGRCRAGTCSVAATACINDDDCTTPETCVHPECARNSQCTGVNDTCVVDGLGAFPFTTTRAASSIMDRGAVQGSIQALAADGANFSCLSLLNSTTSGAKLVASAPALDSNTGLFGFADLNLGIAFVAQ